MSEVGFRRLSDDNGLVHRHRQEAQWRSSIEEVDGSTSSFGSVLSVRRSSERHFEKGKRKLRDLSVPDIIEAPRVWRGYPTEKPSAVSEILITQSTAPGDLVIDPFCGSGSVGVAAITTGRAFMGNDTCTEAVGITRARLLEGGGTEVRPHTGNCASVLKSDGVAQVDMGF